MKIFKAKVKDHFPQGSTLGEVLKKISKLDDLKVGEAAQKGAVWLQRSGKGKILKARDLRIILKPDDLVTLNYDERVLSIKLKDHPVLLQDSKHYGVWFKPAGMVTQGTPAGDHTSLLRLVEIEKKKEIYLIHRLDRETAGLTIVGYSSEGARELSKLFVENKIKKIYHALILGLPSEERQTISASLDGKEAITHFKVLKHLESVSLIEVELETGRLHQIRRHLDFIGHPVMGDPKYGRGNKNRQGLKLLAKSLSFIDPWDNSSKHYECVETLDGP